MIRSIDKVAERARVREEREIEREREREMMNIYMSIMYM